MKTYLQIFSVLAFVVIIYPAKSAVITVQNLNNSGPRSLRQAVSSGGPGDTINFNPALSGSLILTSGQIYIGKNLTFIGSPAVSIGTNGNSRVFTISTVHVKFRDMIFSEAGFIAATSSLGGGVISSKGNVELRNCQFNNNNVRGYGTLEGGSIFNFGDMTIIDCRFDRNYVKSQNNDAKGGAISNVGTMTIVNTFFDTNIAESSTDDVRGGAISNIGSLTLKKCIFDGNSAFADQEAYGGAIANTGSLMVDSSFIGGSQAEGYRNVAGGGISSSTSSARLIISRSVVSGNKTQGFVDFATGGNIDNQSGYLFISDSEISGCLLFGSAQESGGGGINNKGGTVHVLNSTINENLTFGGKVAYGGGIRTTGGNVLIEKSTINSNDISSEILTVGGGIGIKGGNVTVINSTISSNILSSSISSGQSLGGGIFNTGGRLELINSTIVLNAITGSISRAGGTGSNAIITIGSTIVASNTVNGANGPDGFVSNPSNVLDLGYNLIGAINGFNLSSPTNIYGTVASPLDPQLGPLQDNGGPTFTHALLTGSPAIDAGDPLSTLTEDQRGFLRPFNGRIDIGSFESGSDSAFTVFKTASLPLNKPSSIAVYPNPVRDVLTIGDVSGNYEINMTDVLSNEVYKGFNASRVDVSALQPGIYIITIKPEEDQEVQIFQVVKQ